MVKNGYNPEIWRMHTKHGLENVFTLLFYGNILGIHVKFQGVLGGSSRLASGWDHHHL